jgi:hypothetical protein
MVGTIKRWLGIEALERENLTLARALKAAHRRIGEMEKRVENERLWFAKQCDELRNGLTSELKSLDEPLNQCLADGEIVIALDKRVLELEKHLTSEAARPKIEPKPKRTTWKQFRSAAEKANDLEEIA